jgi:3-dehydroquinate dehydratase-1
LFQSFLPYASLLDVELRSVRALPDIVSSAHASGVKLVLSSHHFRSTPSPARMLELQRQAFEAGADLFKVAALASTAPMLARLLNFIARPSRRPRAVMGMGVFGPVSRLALAKAGSALNYGYLDRPNAPGQWEARELKRLIGCL